MHEREREGERERGRRGEWKVMKKNILQIVSVNTHTHNEACDGHMPGVYALWKPTVAYNHTIHDYSLHTLFLFNSGSLFKDLNNKFRNIA